MEGKLYNLTLLEKTAMGNKDFMNKMIQMFIMQTPPLVDEIKSHLSNKEWGDIKSKAHKIKPSIDLMGIESLKTDIRSIEEYSLNQTNLDLLPSLIEKLDNTLSSVYLQLKQEI